MTFRLTIVTRKEAGVELRRLENDRWGVAWGQSICKRFDNREDATALFERVVRAKGGTR